MSGDETPGEGGTRTNLSYSEVLKSTPSTRPAPINTAVARAMQEGAKTTSATASSGFWSAANAPLDTGLTVATSLFSPSIWSPMQQGTQSATIPEKLSWETAINPLNSATPTKQTPPQSPAVGLGLNLINSDSVAPTTSNMSANGTPYQYKQHDIAHSQTRPFSRDGGVRLASTAPLVQHPFYELRNHTARNYVFAQPPTFGGVEAMYNIATTGASSRGDDASQASATSFPLLQFNASDLGSAFLNIRNLRVSNPDASASEWSYISEISEHVEKEDIGKKPDSIPEDAHPKNFLRTRLDESIQFSEAFPGAEAVCTGINPSHYSMEYGVSVGVANYLQNALLTFDSLEWSASRPTSWRTFTGP